MHNISFVPAKDGLDISDKVKALMEKVITAAIAHEGHTFPCDVYIMITDDGGICQLNNEHRGKNSPTDVLSFPMQEFTPGEEYIPSPLELDPDTGALMLGDIVISLDRAKAQAEEFNHSLTRELCFLCAHSILHLLGYDHELSEEDEKIHFALQEELLESCGISRDVGDE
ncbi:MAG: rRNA maturation RNase YbeY [Clostridia bacterium]|nr:rRNA maturation RNase YbeY [Clostridia bacterium]